MKATGGGYGFNVFLPCPLSPAFSLPTSVGGASPVITIYGERYRGGRPRTIFRCGYCEAPFSLGEPELEILRRLVDPVVGARFSGRDSTADRPEATAVLQKR